MTLSAATSRGRRIAWLAATLAVAAGVLWLLLALPPPSRAPFVLAVGPQIGSNHGLAGTASQGGPAAYLEAVQAASGLGITLIRAPSIERAVLMLHEHSVDGVALTLPSTATMLPPSVAMSPSFYSGSSVLVTRKDTAYRSLSSLEGHRVGVLAHGEYHAFLAQHFPAITLFPLATPEDMVAAVDTGAIDAALGVDAVLAPLARQHFKGLTVHIASDAPPVEVRVAALPHRASEVAVAHQAFLTLPLDTQQDILERWLDARHRAPPTLEAVLSHHQGTLTATGLSVLAILGLVAAAHLRSRRLISRQRHAAQILNLVNHEARNGATAVISAIDLLETDTDPTRRDQLLRSSRAAAEALNHSLTNALEFMFRTDGNRRHPGLLHAAHHTIEECVSAMQPLAHRKGLALSLATDGPLPAQAQCDPRALHHIASNFFSNAIKFSEQGEIVVALRFIAGVGDAGIVELRVTDTGPGIRAEDHARIFEPFNTTRAGQLKRGAGIGLSLCRRIAVAQGGAVTVSSAPGHGATFVARLRGYRAQTPHAVAPAPPAPPAPPPTRGRSLVIEDHAAVAAALKRRLQILGFEVHVAGSGLQALSLIQAHGPYTLITVDGTLLDANGSDLAMALRFIERGHNWSSARVMSVSGAGDALDRSAYAQAEVAVFLGKPIDWHAFDEAVAGAGAGAAQHNPALPTALRGTPEILEVQRTQWRQDLDALTGLIRTQNWRGALDMAHRMHGAAALVGDEASASTLSTLQACLKAHAINGDPTTEHIQQLTASLAQAVPE